MPRWHHSDSSSERYQEVKSIKTFYAAHISRSQAKSMFGNWARASCLLLGPPGSNCFSFAPKLVGYSAPRDLHRRATYSICESWFLIHQDVYHDLFVCSS